MNAYVMKPRAVDAERWQKPGDVTAEVFAYFDMVESDAEEKCPVCGAPMAEHGAMMMTEAMLTPICPGDWLVFDRTYGRLFPVSSTDFETQFERVH